MASKTEPNLPEEMDISDPPVEDILEHLSALHVDSGDEGYAADSERVKKEKTRYAVRWMN